MKGFVILLLLLLVSFSVGYTITEKQITPIDRFSIEWKGNFVITSSFSQEENDSKVRIVIENPTDERLEDWQVKIPAMLIILTIGENFTLKTEDGEELPYCFENPSSFECDKTPNSGYIWVKIPEIPPSSSITIFAERTTESTAKDGEDVFDFYDDFDSLELNESKWNISNPELFTMDGEYLILDRSFLGEFLKIRNNFETPFVIDLSFVPPAGISIPTKIVGIVLDSNCSYEANSSGVSSTSGGYYVYVGSSGYKQFITVNGATTYSQQTFSLSDNLYNLEIGVLNNATQNVLYYDGKPYQLETTAENEGIHQVGICGILDNPDDTYSVKIDVVRIRKSAEQEPVVKIYAPLPYFLISNGEGEKLENFQIQLNISKILEEYGNFSLIDEMGNEIPYCFENGDPLAGDSVAGKGECKETPDMTHPIAWAKVPIIPKGTLRIYVVNSSSSHSTSGKEIFDLYDDFTSQSDEWYYSNAYVSNGVVKISQNGYISAYKTFSAPYKVETRIRFDYPYWSYYSAELLGIYHNLSDSLHYLSIWGITQSGDALQLKIRDGYNYFSSSIEPLFTVYDFSFLSYELSSSPKAYLLQDVNLLIKINVSGSYPPFAKGKLKLQRPYYCPDCNAYIDWIRVRKPGNVDVIFVEGKTNNSTSLIISSDKITTNATIFSSSVSINTDERGDNSLILPNEGKKGDAIAFNWYTLSDKRTKVILGSIQEARDKLNKVKVIQYEDGKYGVSAQSVKDLFPFAVEEINGIYAVDYNQLAVVLLEALKEREEELRKMNEELKKLAGEKG